MDDLELRSLMQDAMIPFICEHTGLPAVKVLAVLQANDAFWRKWAGMYGVDRVRDAMSCEDVDESEADGG